MSDNKIDKQVRVPNSDLTSLGNIYQKMINEVEDYAIILLDLDGVIKHWNKGAEKIKQYSEAEAVGMNFRAFYLPEDLQNHLPEKMLEQASISGRAIHEGWRLRKDGTRFWGNVTLTSLHDDEGQIIGYSKVTRDLTDKKLADDHLLQTASELRAKNEELQKSEERYHRMIAEVQDYAIILLNENGDIQNWNVGAQRIKQYTADEIIGRNFRIFYLPEDQEAGLPEKLISQAVESGKATHEGWRVRKSGERFWGSIVITALHSANGEIMGFSKVTRDLTERKLSEDKVQKYLIDLEAQNRELERFAYIASHDLQEPLRKIRTFIDVIAANFHDEQLVRKYFSKIEASAERMSDLIKAVLNYSRLGKVDNDMGTVNLNKVLKDVLNDFEVNIQEKGAVISSDMLPPVKGNELQISQVFFNLIGNALKFSNERPEIGISSRVVRKEQLAKPILEMNTGNYLEIAFADNGIGFEQQYGEKIFTLFQRLHGKQDYSGTGIGLSLCKRIMENHGGHISAEGRPGAGATFSIYFPL